MNSRDVADANQKERVRELQRQAALPVQDKLILALAAMIEWRESGRLPWPLPGGCSSGPELLHWCRRVLREIDTGDLANHDLQDKKEAP